MGNSYTPNISYNKKRVRRSKHYTIMIPDDAFLRTNVKMANGKVREFVAFLSPNKDDHWYNYEMAPVCFMASPNAIPDNASIEAFELLMRITAAQTDTEATMHRYDRGEIHGAICCQKCAASCTNFHIIAGKDGHMYQFRVVVNRRMSEDKMLNWVTGWLDTMKLVDASPKEPVKASSEDELRKQREQEIIRVRAEAAKKREKEKEKERRKMINKIKQFFSKQGTKYFTVSEIRDACFDAEEVTTVSVGAVIGYMVDEGFIVRKSDRRATCFACKQNIIQEIEQFFRMQGAKYYTVSDICNTLFNGQYNNSDILPILDSMVEGGYLVDKKRSGETHYACKQNVIEEASSELTAAKENLSQCKKKFSSISKLEKQLEEMKAENLVKIKAAQEAVEAAKAAYESCVEQKDKAQKELEGMGFFAFGEKKKAKAEIALLDNRAASLYTALTCTQSDKEKLEQSVEADEISAQNNIDKIRTDYSAAQERFENATEIEKMRKALQK